MTDGKSVTGGFNKATAAYSKFCYKCRLNERTQSVDRHLSSLNSTCVGWNFEWRVTDFTTVSSLPVFQKCSNRSGGAILVLGKSQTWCAASRVAKIRKNRSVLATTFWLRNECTPTDRNISAMSRTRSQNVPTFQAQRVGQL